MDIDLDFQSKFDGSTIFPQLIKASMVNSKQELVKHPCGIYLQTIPVDTLTGLAAIPHNRTKELGFFKIDFLHATVLDSFVSTQELKDLSTQTPDWNLLLSEGVVKKLIHVSNHIGLLQAICPTSVEELADCLALIRPSKRYLVSSYSRANSQERTRIRPELYRKPNNDEIWFKKSHSIAYALTIVAQLNLAMLGRL